MRRQSSSPSLAPIEATRRRFLNVVGVSLGKRPRWRWRIVNGLGEILQESTAQFPTLPSALADGRRHNSQDIDNHVEDAGEYGERARECDRVQQTPPLYLSLRPTQSPDPSVA